MMMAANGASGFFPASYHDAPPFQAAGRDPSNSLQVWLNPRKAITLKMAGSIMPSAEGELLPQHAFPRPC